MVSAQNDFSYFFNPNGREQCYISPERFYVSSDAQGIWRQQAALQPSMVSMYHLKDLTSCLGLHCHLSAMLGSLMLWLVSHQYREHSAPHILGTC